MAKRSCPLLLGAALTGAALALPGLDTTLRTRRYTVRTGRFTQPVRLALASDFHAGEEKANRRRLLSALETQAPDLLLIPGDLFDRRRDHRNVERLLQELEGRWPAYYVTGNHEYSAGPRTLTRDMATLERHGVRRLSGERVTLAIRGQTFDLCGVDDPSAAQCCRSAPGERGRASFYRQLSRLAEGAKNENYTVLLSHRPEQFPLYAACGFDLALCGHAHGGQWRLPGLLNGLYAPDQGLFPRYAGGRYQAGNTVMIVSRGLARENTRVPRFYDPPELVIVDLV